MAQVQLQWAGSPGGPAVRLLLPPGCGRRLWLQASTSVTGVTVAFFPSGLTSGFPALQQTFTPASGLPQAQSSGLPVADDRVFVDISFQGAAGSQVAAVVDDGRPCCA